MPLFFITKLNKLTLKLFTLMNAVNEDVAALKSLLQESIQKSSSLPSKKDSINFNSRVKIQGSHKTIFSHATSLDVAILKRHKSNYVNILIDHIFIQSRLNKNIQQAIFISALCTCCAINALDHLRSLLKLNLDIHSKNLTWTFEATNLPLNIAVKMGNQEIIVELLRRGIKPSAVDSRGRNAYQMATMRSNEKSRKILELLHIPDYLQCAQDAHLNKKLARFYVEKATCANPEWVCDYLQQLSYLAIQQLVEQRSQENYLFLKYFICVFMEVIQANSQTEKHKRILIKFQLDVLMHLVGAYDCQLNLPENLKLFTESKEKFLFFAPLLRETNLVKSTLTIFAERQYLPVATTESIQPIKKSTA